MLNERARNYPQHKAMFDSVISYVAGEESSYEEKKAAIDFLADYVKSQSRERAVSALNVIKHISKTGTLGIREYCKEVLQ